MTLNGPLFGQLERQLEQQLNSQLDTDDFAGGPGGGGGGIPTYTPSLDFRDARNSQYAAGQFAIGVGVN